MQNLRLRLSFLFIDFQIFTKNLFIYDFFNICLFICFLILFLSLSISIRCCFFFIIIVDAYCFNLFPIAHERNHSLVNHQSAYMYMILHKIKIKQKIISFLQTKTTDMICIDAICSFPSD